MATPYPFPSLGLSADVEDAVRTRLLPFVEARAVSILSCLTAAAAARRLAVDAPDTVLAFALAFAATEHGHTGYRIGTAAPLWLRVPVPRDPQVEADASANGPVPTLESLLPQDAVAWREAIVASPGVVSVAPVAGSTGVEHSAGALFVLQGGLLQVQRMAAAELRIAARLERLATQAAPDFDALGVEGRAWLLALLAELFRRTGPVASHAGVDRQKLAVLRVVQGHLTVVTGGPGMGKTFSIRAALLALWWAWRLQGRDAPRVALAAPTGKAAARMREAIQEALETTLASVASFVAAAPPPGGTGPTPADLSDYLGGLEEFTLHRLLGVAAQKASSFHHDAANPLPYDVVVVDEASMADVHLVDALLAAVDPATTRLVIVGDRNQLASVDAGTVLADICGPAASQSERLARPLVHLAARWGLPGDDVVALVPDRPLASAVVAFREFFRFQTDSGVAELARSVIAHDPENWPVHEVMASIRRDRHDFRWVRTRDAETRRRAALDEAEAAYAPLLREHAQDEFVANEGQQLVDSDVPRWIALQTAFDRFRLLTSHRGGEDGVHSLNHELTARLLGSRDGVASPGHWAPAPSSTDRPWLGQPLLVTQNDYGLGLYNGDIGFVLRVRTPSDGVRLRAVFRIQRGVDSYWRILAPSRLAHAETALAMTIHKCQGSQFHKVALLLPRQHSPLLTRELVYTGLTRAREKATLYGSEEVVQAALTARVQRDAGLAVRLWGDG